MVIRVVFRFSCALSDSSQLGKKRERQVNLLSTPETEGK
jgi:hypothetical protein